jgi:glycine/D-amino acid oxidase-like deaminating enzyme
MRVGVLGGGLQGCCAALALAARGVRVTLFDRNEQLLSRAAIANEGKIHLGYMYAGDPTLSTARAMMRGALHFAPFFARHLGRRPAEFKISAPAVYLVHRDSQHSVEEISGYLEAVHLLLGEAAKSRPGAYFGAPFPRELRVWSAAERIAEFDPETIVAAFETPELAINPVELALAVRECIAGNPNIEVRLGHTVVSAHDESEQVRVHTQQGGEDGSASYDHVVNALWDGRLAIDKTYGIRVDRPWLHRLKYGVRFRRHDGAPQRSATVISGPFGEVVSYGDGLTYLTWYPDCGRGISRDTTPPDWPGEPSEPLRSRIASGTLAALSEFVVSLRGVNLEHVSEFSVQGGTIVAWGSTDIYDPQSELHRRFEIGVSSVGRFHSVDPGKLTMAPYFADVCADRIQPVAGNPSRAR